ncbi:MAG: lipid A biosynthesis (KDO)2-(lauroyl)-lipid IVA acyltransferase [Bacteroidales bacterium]|nr:lipid A biosynthesis (KDO)2-(lauroyl)-lipid IVA acyltransferase [Bacteroidales bacterium]MDD4671003.1 lipid A biosynthesis (KDO)2-(lauroyl)-lipid IVA acyltransferase [Bacteroidales bacterium]
MAERKWSGKTGGGSFGQKAMIAIFNIVDVAVIYPTLFFIVPFYMVINGKECLCILKYMHKIQGFNIIKSFFMTFWNHVLFGMMMLDRFAIYSGQKSRFKIETDGIEAFNKLIDREKGFMLAGAHVGNFEMAGYELHQDKKRINAVVFGGETAAVQSNRSKVMQANSIRMVPVSSDMSHIFIIKAALDNGDVVSMPCDRVFGSSKSIELDFLGHKAKFPIGGFVMAEKMDVAMLGVFVFKTSLRGYKVYVRPLGDNKAENYAKELGILLKEYPCQFFNYYDFWELNKTCRK